MVIRAGRFYTFLVVAVLAAATAIRIADPFSLQAIRLIAFDTYQRLEPQAYDPRYPVRVVDIDEDSLERVGQWPWPRTIMAELLRKLAGQGAAVVAFDILFSEPDQTSPGSADRGDDRTVSVDAGSTGGTAGAHDARFAETIATRPTVLAAALTHRVTDDSAIPQKAGFAVAGDDPAPFLAAFEGATANLAALDQAAAGIGAINWVPDRDQVIRRVPLIYRLDDNFVPAFAAEALRVAQGAGTYVLKASNASGETAFGQTSGLNHIKIGEFEVPTDSDGGVWLRFRPSNPASFVPAWAVLAGENDAAEIAGRIILVGTSAPGLADLRATPLGTSFPGVEIHAEIVEHILSGEALTRPDYALAAELTLVIILGLAVSFVLPRVSAVSASAIGVFVVVGLLAGGWLAYRQAGLLLDPTYPAMSLAGLIGAATATLYRRVEQQRSQVRRAFGYYVAPAVVDEIIAHPERLELGGEVRELTIVFLDVRNFTTISEQMEAQELIRFVNNVLTPLSQIILDHRGTIDKYMGDAIMAFWNAPLDDPDHATHAATAAIEMVQAAATLDRTWSREAAAAGRPHTQVAIGIGISTGDCCVGNLGSQQRFDYSAIGDHVNVASRLQGLSKIYGVPIVAGEATISRITDPVVLELDLVRVRGRAKPMRIFTLASILLLDARTFDALLPLHADLLRRYRLRDWDGAEKAIDACRELRINQLETFYMLYRTRILSYREIPPPTDWDAAELMLTN